MRTDSVAGAVDAEGDGGGHGPTQREAGPRLADAREGASFVLYLISNIAH